jgi:hypothetical protein
VSDHALRPSGAGRKAKRTNAVDLNRSQDRERLSIGIRRAQAWRRRHARLLLHAFCHPHTSGGTLFVRRQYGLKTWVFPFASVSRNASGCRAAISTGWLKSTR